MDSTALRVITLNCWGLKAPLSKLREERIDAIGRHLARIVDIEEPAGRKVDVVCLQEVWVHRDFDVIKNYLSDSGIQHAQFFRSGLVGSGLAIYSRYPMIETFFSPYALQGSPLNVTGDYYANKGVAIVTIDAPSPLGLVDIMTTHMYAPGGEVTDPSGVPRLSQAWDFAKYAISSRQKGRHVVATGDLNSQPESIVIKLIQQKAHLIDSFIVVHDEPYAYNSDEFRALDETGKMMNQGITCDSPLCSWSAPKLAHKSIDDPVILRRGKRLDYVFYNSPECADVALRAVSCDVTFTEIIPYLQQSFSDHFAVDVSFSLAPSSTIPKVSTTEKLKETLHASFSLISRYNEQNDDFMQKSIYVCAAALFLAFGLVVVPPFVPYYITWLWVLLAILSAAIAIFALIGGWLHSHTEQSYLFNILNDINSSEGY